jgi:hypothetical protein
VWWISKGDRLLNEHSAKESVGKFILDKDLVCSGEDEELRQSLEQYNTILEHPLANGASGKFVIANVANGFSIARAFGLFRLTGANIG